MRALDQATIDSVAQALARECEDAVAEFKNRNDGRGPSVSAEVAARWGAETFEDLRPLLDENARRRDESFALSRIPRSLRQQLGRKGRRSK